jgi:hypothetical protein
MSAMRFVCDFRKAASFLFIAFLAVPVIPQEAGQKTFKSAQEATSALVMAAKNNDEQAILEILGADGKKIITSGDAKADAEDRANFIARYEEMHRLMKEPDGTTTLYVGSENWPAPIPLAEKNGAWYFDTQVAKKEILYRRIGRNEISTIGVCKELAAAEKEYYSAHKQYAQRIVSSTGQKDGLYWKVTAGQPKSPVGPLVAMADDEGPSATPYRGYYFHALTPQGAGASSSFAFIAYPANYRSSGVMTFVVDDKGIVYRKDLGKETPTVAKAMKEYNPDSTWKQDEDQQEEAAAK